MTKDTIVNNMNSTYNYKLDFYDVYSFIATAFIAFCGNKSNTILSIIALLIFVPLIFKPKYLLGPILFVTIFDEVLVAFNGQSFSRFLCIYMILGFLVTSYMQRGIRLTKDSILLTILMLMGVLLSLWGLFGYTSFPSAYLFGVLQAFVLANIYSIQENHISETLYKYSVASIFYCIYMINSGRYLINVDDRLFQGINANQLAFGITVIGSILFSHFLLVKRRKKFIHIVLLLAVVYCIYLTGSRTGLLACILSALIILSIVDKWEKHSLVKSFFILVAVTAALIGVYAYLSLRFPNLMNRFTIGNVVTTGGTNRILIWKTYFQQYFPSYWLLGIGFDPQNMYYAIERFLVTGHGAHNIIIDILSVSGVLGLVVFLGCFTKWIKLFVSKINENEYLIIPFGMLLCVLFMGIGEDVIRSKMLWLSLGLCFEMVNVTKKNESDN